MNAGTANFSVNRVFPYLQRRPSLWTPAAEPSNVHARFQFIEFTRLYEEI